jgi:DNA-binding NarL/FixJ family response regulator
MRDAQDSCEADPVAIPCLIVDDNESFLQAARVLLEREGMSVAGVALTRADALRQVESLRPEVILVDIFLGDESGLELARRLVEEAPGSATVILISTHAEADVANLITGSPAAGFLTKAELSAEAILGMLDGRAA